jgi:hypothetical protein
MNKIIKLSIGIFLIFFTACKEEYKEDLTKKSLDLPKPTEIGDRMHVIAEFGHNNASCEAKYINFVVEKGEKDLIWKITNTGTSNPSSLSMRGGVTDWQEMFIQNGTEKLYRYSYDTRNVLSASYAGNLQYDSKLMRLNFTNIQEIRPVFCGYKLKYYAPYLNLKYCEDVYTGYDAGSKYIYHN